MSKRRNPKNKIYVMSINKIGDAEKESVSANAFVCISAVSCAGDLIGNNQDLLRNILFYFDNDKSLCRSKLVSKLWHSIICNPSFSLAWRTKHVPTPCGLMMVNYRGVIREHYKTQKFIEFDEYEESPPSPPNFDLNSLSFKGDDSGYKSSIKVLQYSNGLLLVTRCLLNDPDMRMKELAVFNPTTNQFKLIPEISKNQGRWSEALLAFDPYKSRHYKIIMMMVQNMHVYESESDTWSVRPLKECQGWLELGVYWNEAIHWIKQNNFYFDINNLCFKKMPKIPFLGGIGYFGESGGHLLLIEHQSSLQFDIFEMELDYSKWVVKYNVDLTTLRVEFPVGNIRILACIIGRDKVIESVELIFKLVEPHNYSEEEIKAFSCGEYPTNSMIISYNLQTEKVKNLGHLSGHAKDYYRGVYPFIRLPTTVL